VLFGAEPAAADAVLRAAVERGTVSSFRPVRPTLGEIFRDIVVSSPTTTENTTQTEDTKQKEAAV
jgi:ABC-2 type transport system ATP-binding protein